MGNYICTFNWKRTGDEHYMSDQMDRIGDRYLILETKPPYYHPDKVNFAYGIEGLVRYTHLTPYTNLMLFAQDVLDTFPEAEISYQITYHPPTWISEDYTLLHHDTRTPTKYKNS